MIDGSECKVDGTGFGILHYLESRFVVTHRVITRVCVDNGCRASQCSYAASACGTVMKEAIFFCLSYYQHSKRLVIECQKAFYQQKADEVTAYNESYSQVLVTRGKVR
jgi:hypothetical protein